MSVGGYVGACSAAEGEGGGAGPGRAGFLKISARSCKFRSCNFDPVISILGRGRLLFENASLVDFPIVNEQKVRKMQHFRGFTIGKVIIGRFSKREGDGGSPGGDWILSTQRMLCGGDWILSTQRIW